MKENKKKLSYNAQYPSIQDLKKKAKRQIPKFAFDYLEGGCNEDVSLFRNKSDLQDIILMPQYLKIIFTVIPFKSFRTKWRNCMNIMSLKISR